MRVLGIAAVFAVVCIGASCVTEPVEEKLPGSQHALAISLNIGNIPRIAQRSVFEDVLLWFKQGTELDRRTAIAAFQVYMDVCLPFIIDHLEGEEPFAGLTYQPFGRKGARLRSVTIPSEGYNVGAALEYFLAYYFRSDPARRTFNVEKREGAVELWRRWYARRADSFHWDESGFYRSK